MIFSIIELIPVGYDNAISRAQLTRLCDEFGLIDADVVDKDRAMRSLLSKAKLDWAILSREDGGYYQPDIKKAEDVDHLRHWVEREDKRAKAIFMAVKKAKAVLDDANHGRFEAVGFNPYQE